MKKILLALSLTLPLVACAQPHYHQHGHDNFGRNLAAAVVILGTIGAVTAATQPAPPQVIYNTAPVYPQRMLAPQVRVVTSWDVCYRYGQAVQTYDQWGVPMGYQICR